jgi:tetratricopeptide (TPR) repeat protein
VAEASVRYGVILRAIVLSVCFAVTGAAAADLSAEQAYTLVVQKPWTPSPTPKPDELAAARKALDAAAAKESGSARWSYALGHLASLEARSLKGDAAEEKREEAVDHFEKATERDPKNADYLFWLADASFERIDDVNMLSKMSLASDGRKAYEKAVSIDPQHVGAHVGLGQYYMQAPGIAGGSVDKAKKEGETLIAIPGGRGAFQGNMLLAGIAAKAQDWGEMSRRYTAAETASGDGANPAVAMRSQAWLLLHEKKDAKAAQPVMDRYLKIASPDDLTALFLDGEVKRELGRCADALPRYAQVLAKYPAAVGSRWGSAVCHEAVGQKDAARRDYEEFIKRFPEDEKAKDAKAAVKRLSG